MSKTLAKTSSKLLFLIFSLAPVAASAQHIIIKGIIRDVTTNLAVPYTSIGVKNKAFGTVADSLGNFSFTIPENSLSELDTVVFGHVGYLSFRKALKDLQKADIVIMLSPRPISLNEVNVSAYRKGKIELYGRTPASVYLTPRAYRSIPRSDAKGREQATILEIDNNIILKEINFFLSRSNYTKVAYRINFYSVENDLPSRLLSTKDIIYKTNQTHEWQNVNLEAYNIHLVGKKKIAIGFQLIHTEILPTDTAKTSFLIASYPSPLRKSYFREKSESEWVPVSSSYLFVNIKAFRISAKKTEKSDVEVQKQEGQKLSVSPEHQKLLFGNNFDFGKKVEVDSVSIYYESYGKGEPLILLHGNNESMASFREQLIPLSEKFNVIAIDSRGQGTVWDLSKAPYTYELFAKDVISVMDCLKINKANIIGWSDGGNIGLILSSKYPQRINRLAVFGANLFPGKGAIEEDVVRVFEKRKLDLMKSSASSSSNQLRLTNLVLEEPNIQIAQLNEIKAPVLVMAGEKDVVIAEHTKLISKSIYQSRFYVFPKGDHYVPVKQPTEFNKVVLKFMLEK